MNVIDNMSLPVPVGHKLVNPFVLFRQQNSSGGFFKGDVIRMDHNTGAVLRKHGNDVMVLEGDQLRFIVNPNEMVDRWVKYVNGELVQQAIYRIADGEMAPKREELDDIDWKERRLKRDPWQREVYLPMKDIDGEIVAFKATGGSAIGEIGELVGMYGSANRKGLVPAVEIESGSFESQHGNTVHYPVFRLVGWKLWDGEPLPPVQPVAVPVAPPGRPTPALAKPMPSAPPPPIAIAAPDKGGDLNDEIPF
jgi:hypothetical protein